MTQLVFRREELDSDVVQALIRDLNEELSAVYPEEGATHFRLDADEVAPGRGAFVVGYRDDGTPVACGAVRRLDTDRAELKRMYVIPAERGRGFGNQVLAALEQTAARLGIRRIVLETGVRQREAIAMYERAGYEHVPAFEGYVGSPLSYCMSKRI